MSKSIATAAPATVANPLDPTGAILAAKLDVPADAPNRARALRDAAVMAAGKAYGPITIDGEYTSTDGVKFSAWISGARGFNGYAVTTSVGRFVVGLTTLRAMCDNGHVTNPQVLDSAANAPTVRGILA